MSKIRNLLFLITLLPLISPGQTDYLKDYYEADSLLQNDLIEEGYSKFKKLEPNVPPSDTLYDYVLWYYTWSTTYLEHESRMNENFETSLNHGLEALELIKKGKERFDGEFAKREPFMIKNIIVSYFGLGKYKEAEKYKLLLYEAYEDKTLPDGIDEYFNYDFFRLDNKNIWGYEWFAKLPEDRFSTSFTKVIYYVYSTNPDGSDKDQLYRLHVLMFHGNNKNFDYVMDKRLETATDEVNGTLYSYTYKENIDYKKLHNDVIEVVNGNLQPDTKRTISKEKDKNGIKNSIN